MINRYIRITNTDGHILPFFPYNKDALMNLSHDFLLFGLY